MRILNVIIACVVTASLCADVAQAQRDRRGEQPRRERDRQSRDAAGLRVGQLAPTFTLESLDGQEKFELKEFRGQKPVILFFGSYT